MSLLSRQGTNQIGLTQGNPRVTNSGIINGLEMGRPTFGREFNMQLRYKFGTQRLPAPVPVPARAGLWLPTRPIVFACTD